MFGHLPNTHVLYGQHQREVYTWHAWYGEGDHHLHNITYNKITPLQTCPQQCSQQECWLSEYVFKTWNVPQSTMQILNYWRHFMSLPNSICRLPLSLCVCVCTCRMCQLSVRAVPYHGRHAGYPLPCQATHPPSQHTHTHTQGCDITYWDTHTQSIKCRRVAGWGAGRLRWALCHLLKFLDVSEDDSVAQRSAIMSNMGSCFLEAVCRSYFWLANQSSVWLLTWRLFWMLFGVKV